MTPPALLAKGLGFTEGPLWHPEHGLLVVGLSRGLVWQVDIDSGSASSFAAPGGRPNGLACDASGTVWIAQAGGDIRSPSIQRMRDGRVETVLEDNLHAPNDLCVGPDDRIWFTDPAGHALADHVPPGRVWVFDPNNGKVEQLSDSIRYPNGLAFSPDRSTLYVAETASARILCFDVAQNGLGQGREFAMLEKGMPDGLAVDIQGNVYVAAVDADSVMVFNSNGKLVETINFPQGSVPTNLCFGGPDLKTLFVTAAKGGSVYSASRTIAGLGI